ncbi:hypothetical protein AAFN60_03995 [Roseibacillus persicicus]|uniref:hypothetical protein n=1 Tax=Roseibacillus persicicus TaxID=454148 RepID=UPI00398AB863
MNLPAPPKESDLIRSEIGLILKTRASLSLLALVALAQIFPILTYGAEIYLPIRIILWLLLSLSLLYQARILVGHRGARRLRRWRNWQQQRFSILRERVDYICGNRADVSRARMQDLLVSRSRLVALLEEGSPMLANEKLDYQLEFDRLTNMALDALEESGNKEPLEKVLELASQLEKEIPVALADAWQAPSFDNNEFERTLEGFRNEHGVKVGITRRGLKAGKN